MVPRRACREKVLTPSVLCVPEASIAFYCIARLPVCSDRECLHFQLLDYLQDLPALLCRLFCYCPCLFPHGCSMFCISDILPRSDYVVLLSLLANGGGDTTRPGVVSQVLRTGPISTSTSMLLSLAGCRSTVFSELSGVRLGLLLARSMGWGLVRYDLEDLPLHELVLALRFLSCSQYH